MDTAACTQLQHLFTARATTWWCHYVPLAISMRVERPDLAALGRQLAAAFPVVLHEYVGDALAGDDGPQRWQRRLVAYTGLLPSGAPPFPPTAEP